METLSLNPETQDSCLFHPINIVKICIKNIIDNTAIEIDTVHVNETASKQDGKKIIDMSITILRNKLETTSCSFWLLPPNRPQCFPVYIEEYDTTVVFKGCENDDNFFLMAHIRPGRVYSM